MSAVNSTKERERSEICGEGAIVDFVTSIALARDGEISLSAWSLTKEIGINY
jgi:hypothetical protein